MAWHTHILYMHVTIQTYNYNGVRRVKSSPRENVDRQKLMPLDKSTVEQRGHTKQTKVDGRETYEIIQFTLSIYILIDSR